MHHVPRLQMRRVATATALVAVAAMVTGGQMAAGAATHPAPGSSAASSSSSTGAVRTVSLAGTTTLPAAGTVAQGVAGFSTVSEAGATRSLSPRPAAGTASAAAATAAGLAPPVVASTSVTNAQPGLQRSWQGINNFQQSRAFGFSVEPPDQALCVGNGFAFEAVNVALRVYHQSTGKPATRTASLNAFYHYPPAFNPKTNRSGPFLTDPVCLFDRASQRFFLVVLTLDVNPKTGALTGTNHLDIAVSRTGNPLGRYNIYKIPATDNGSQGTPRHKSCPCIGDFPHIGLDKFGFYITTNEYPFSGPGVFGNGFNGAQVYAMSKSRLTGGAARLPFVHFENTTLAGAKKVSPGFTLWPAQVPDAHYATANNGTAYFLSSTAGDEANPKGFTGMSNTLGVWQLTNSASLDSANPRPHLSSAAISSEVYGIPPLSTQKIGPVPLRDCLIVKCFGVGPSRNEVEGGLDSSDTRMLTAWLVGGRLYGALDTIMRVQGNLQAGVAWFGVDPGSTPEAAAVKQQGYVGVARNNVIYPSIATLSNGRGVMAATLSGAAYFPSAAYLPFSTAGGPGNVSIYGMGRAPEDGFCEYNFFNCAGNRQPTNRPRWGDYSAAVQSGNDVLLANEYIQSRCTFATFRKDPTCGNTRDFFANWSTRIGVVSP